MRVKFCHNNHANIHSKKERIFDTRKDFGFSDKEWLALSEDEVMEIVKEWALQDFEYWCEEV